MKSIIMAGGEGSRLRPLTCGIPKPMVPVANEPAIKHIIRHLNKFGIKDMGVTLFYLPNKIKDYLDEEYGGNIRYYIEDKPLGTAGSVKNASDFLDETFIVMSGDVITDVNIDEAYNFHRKNGAKVTLVLTRVDIPLEYGVVITESDGRVRKFLEKPSWGEVFSDTVNTGIYIIEPEILEFVPENISFDFSKDLFPLLLKNNIPIYGYITGGYWCDIGNSIQYINSHFDILKGIVDLGFKEKLLKDGVILGKNVIISPEAKLLKPLIIGDNVVIEDNAVIGPFSIIGKNSRIKYGSSVKNSILWDGVTVGNNCELRGCVLCKNTIISNNVRVFENAIVGENTHLKAFCEIKPEVKIWPQKTVDEGSIITRNLVWGSGRKGAIFGERGLNGIFNEDLTPEYVIELGEIFGNIFSGNIVIGHDGIGTSKFIIDLISAGLLSSGCEVLYADFSYLPALRYSIRKNKLSAGVYVESSGEGKMRILFIDNNGCDIDRNIEKKIENKLLVYDFKRADYSKLKDLKHIYLKDDYINYISGNINGALNIVVKPYDKVTEEILYDISKKVTFKIFEKDYDIGVTISRNGEFIELYDDKGRKFDEDELNYLRMLLLKKDLNKNFVLPFDSSLFISKFAKELDLAPLKSKLSYKDRMKKIVEIEGVTTDESSQFNLSFDGINFIVKLMQYMDKEKIKLSTVKEKIPNRYKLNRIIKCDWKDKGKIIRRLFETADDKSTELVDGIKFNYDDSWVMVLPDLELPACRVYAEAPTLDKAENLILQYEKTINSIIGSNEIK